MTGTGGRTSSSADGSDSSCLFDSLKSRKEGLPTVARCDCKKAINQRIFQPTTPVETYRRKENDGDVSNVFQRSQFLSLWNRKERLSELLSVTESL